VTWLLGSVWVEGKLIVGWKMSGLMGNGLIGSETIDEQ
jgi:hypothetical protein